MLNKTKLTHQYNLGKIDQMDFKLTEHQKKLLRFELIETTPGSKPNQERTSLLTKNLNRQNLLQKSNSNIESLSSKDKVKFGASKKLDDSQTGQ